MLSKVLNDLYFNDEESVSVNNVLREYEMKEEIKNSETSVEYNIQICLI